MPAMGTMIVAIIRMRTNVFVKAKGPNVEQKNSNATIIDAFQSSGNAIRTMIAGMEVMRSWKFATMPLARPTNSHAPMEDAFPSIGFAMGTMYVEVL